MGQHSSSESKLVSFSDIITTGCQFQCPLHVDQERYLQFQFPKLIANYLEQIYIKSEGRYPFTF